MDIKDLEGKHVLTGVDYCPTEGETSVLFILDGTTYKITEDDDDGYRSYMSEPEITDERVKNIFPEQKVNVVCENEDILVLYNESEEVIMSVGTDHTDSYYPYAIFNWNPELMDINKLLTTRQHSSVSRHRN